MLVGAPKGENLQPGTNRSGALFKCPLTTYTSDCQQVQTDGLKNSNGLYKGNPDGTLMGPTSDEIKDDQWMGVTLKSQGEGGDILVCGHRYQNKGIDDQNFQWGYGLCYRLSNDFEYKDNYRPCKGKPVDLGHEQFGYCQAGSSGMIMEDEVLLGIPGTYTWRGTIHTRNISDDYLYRDKTQYFGVYTDDDSPVDKYSYLGYSVTAGRFFGNKLSYVAGAPRSRGNGQVIFFSRQGMGNPRMNYDLILNGETFASSFGFEVLALDVNGDKKDDLIVSAPFYFTEQSSGAVYVYLNDGNGISNETPFTRLEGPPGESRFGYSMTSLGDLNRDGFNDLAVGAPYEGRGAIYVFLGSEKGIMKEPSQVIRPEDLPGLPYEAFGYSLSGGMDLDNNNYNDLLTASFCSDRVILLRARPIIDIQTKVDASNLQNINPTKPGCIEDRNSPETCFSFNACFKMINEAGTQTFLSLQYNISERYYNDQPTNRIRFHRAHPDKPSTVEQVVILRPESVGTFQCSREIVYLKGGQRDVLRPVRFKLSYKIHQRDPKPVEEGDPLPDINDYPILNQQEAVRYFEANFAKDCGDDDVCDSNLKIVGELDLERAEGESYYVFELGKRQYFTFTTNVSNDGEPAYQPNLYVSHDKAIDLSLRETDTGSYRCSAVENGLLHCNLDNPLVNSTGPLELVFKPSGLPFKSRYIDLIAWVNSTSQEIERNDDRIKFVLEVKRRAEISITGSAEPEQVFYSGEVVGESAIKTLNEVGTEVVHKYHVDNRGPWKVDDLQVLIHWPYQVENNKKEGKWLLYMTDIPVVEGDGECDVDPELINPLVLENDAVQVGSEVEITGNEKFRGVTPPSVYTTTTKVYKSSGKKVVISEKKTYTKKTSKSSSSSSSSSSAVDNREDVDYDRETSHGRGNSRTYNRVSRKVYSSGSKNRLKGDDKDGSYDYDTDYENYDSFFYGNKGDERKEHDRTVPEEGSGYDDRGYGNREHSRHESTHTKRIYTSDLDTSGSTFGTYSDRLNAVDDIRVVNEDGETYLNGYDKNGILVWSSRRRYPNNLPVESLEADAWGTSTKSKYELGLEEENKERDLFSKMSHIVNFRIIREGDQTWVNGYDRDGHVIWTSRYSWFTPSSGRSHDRIGKEGDGVYESSVKTKYVYKETTRDEDGDGVPETRGSWVSSVTDDAGTRTKNGSTFREEKIGDWSERDRDRSGFYDGGKSYSSGSESRSSSSHHFGRESSFPDEGERDGYSTYRKEYSYRERTRDRDGDGTPETRRSWSSSVTDNNGTRSKSGSSVTEEDSARDHERGFSPNEEEGRYSSGSVSSSSYHGGRTHSSRGSSSYGRGSVHHSEDQDRRHGGHRSEVEESSGTYSSSDHGRNNNRREYVSSHHTPDNDREERYRFDWNYPDNRDSGRTSHDRQQYESNSKSHSGDLNSRWRDTGGFRTYRFDSHSPSGDHEPREDRDFHSSSYNNRHSSYNSRNYDSHKPSDLQNDEHIHGYTYSRAVVDPQTDGVKVYSQKIFSRKSGDHWQEVRGPYRDEEWTKDFSVDEKPLRRTKREREYIIKPEAITDAQTGKTMQIVNFRCDGENPTAKCFTFICTIYSLSAAQSASIRIPARLWNSTLVEDYPRVSFVSIKSKGELLLPDEIRLDQDQSDDVSYAETLAYSNLLEQLPPEEVPLWVILVSILAGLLLLVLIAIILWKLGFFKRKRPDPTLSGNIDRDVNGYN